MRRSCGGGLVALRSRRGLLGSVRTRSDFNKKNKASVREESARISQADRTAGDAWPGLQIDRGADQAGPPMRIDVEYVY